MTIKLTGHSHGESGALLAAVGLVINLSSRKYAGDHVQNSSKIVRFGPPSTIYKGRNEAPNTGNLALTDKVRNIVVAGGALAGISELQWAALLRGLLSPK